MNRSELDQLGLKYGTDKSSSLHAYLERYEPFLAPMRESTRKVLEIGIAGGASLMVWAHYFEHAAIVGVDHNPKCVAGCIDRHPRIFPIQGEATDAAFWPQFKQQAGAEFDLIIDDGSHHSSAIITAFAYAWPLLRSKGLWITEDLHAGYEPEYNRDPGLTSVEYFKTLIDVLNCQGQDMTGNPATGALNYSFLHFGKSFVIIGKP